MALRYVSGGVTAVANRAGTSGSGAGAIASGVATSGQADADLPKTVAYSRPSRCLD